MNDIVLYEIEDANKSPSPKIHVDFNVIELPLFSKNKKAQPNVGALYVISKKKNIVVEVIPVAGMSIPTDFDRKVYFAIVQIALEFRIRHNFDEIPNIIHTTFYEIYSKMNVKWFGGKKKNDTNYAGMTKRIYDSLSKLSGTKYKLFNCFYEAKNSGIEKGLYESSFIHSMRIKKRFSAEKDGDESIKFVNSKSEEIITIQLNPFFLNNLLHAKGHLKHDFQELQRLEDDVAFSIYWNCDKNRKWLGESEFGTDKKMRVTAKTLSSKIPLSFTPKNVSYSVSRIITAFEYLKINKFILDFTVIKGSQLSETEFIVEFSWSRYDNEYVLTGRESYELTEVSELKIEPSTLSRTHDDPIIEEVMELDFNIKKNSIDKIKELLIEFCNDDVKNLFENYIDRLDNETIEIINTKFIEHGLLYLVSNKEYTIRRAKKNFNFYLKKALINNYGKDILDSLEQKEKLFLENKELEKNKQQQIESKKQAQHIKKNEIENNYYKLSDINKNMYIKHAEYIVKKYSDKLKSTLKLNREELEQTLSFSIFAVSNGDSYNKMLELYIQDVLGVNLSIISR